MAGFREITSTVPSLARQVMQYILYNVLTPVRPMNDGLIKPSVDQPVIAQPAPLLCFLGVLRQSSVHYLVNHVATLAL